MKLRDIYARPGLTVSVEFFPPKTPKGEVDLFREIEVLKGLTPAFCPVTYGAGGTTRGKTVEPIVPGVLPIQSTAQTRRFTALCGSRITPRLEQPLAKVEQDDAAALELGIDYATEQCEGLIAFGVPGIHFYSLNKSRSVMAIWKNLSLTTPA